MRVRDAGSCSEVRRSSCRCLLPLILRVRVESRLGVCYPHALRSSPPVAEYLRFSLRTPESALLTYTPRLFKYRQSQLRTTVLQRQRQR